jgi:hypothetical protein
MIAGKWAVAGILPTTENQLPTTGSIPFAFLPPCPYNTAMDSQATVLCETKKQATVDTLWLAIWGLGHGKCHP